MEAFAADQKGHLLPRPTPAFHGWEVLQRHVVLTVWYGGLALFGPAKKRSRAPSCPSTLPEQKQMAEQEEAKVIKPIKHLFVH